MSFRLTTDRNVHRQAQIFNEAPFAMSVFPSGSGERAESVIEIDNQDVLLSSVKADGDKYRLTLYNASDSNNDAVVKVMGKSMNLNFTKHELKFIEI
jgi:hypothetical protein